MSTETLEVIIRQINERLASIERHIGILNDEHGELVIQMTALTTKMEIMEKLCWIIIGASVTAIVGSVYSLILHKRNGNGGK